MAKVATMEFKRNRPASHQLVIPLDSWSDDGTLYFVAKPQPDDDNTDSKAVINKSFSDSAATVNEVAGTVTYDLEFSKTDITRVSFADGSSEQEYVGEFTFIDADGSPESFPAADDYIAVIIYANLKDSE